MFILIKRIIRSSWKSFYRNKGLSLATLLIMVITMSLFTSLFLLRGITDFLILEIQKRADISVFFNLNVLEEEILKIENKLDQMPEVKEVQYVSREEALEKFKERHKDNPAIMAALEEIGVNPFPVSLNIRAVGLKEYAIIANFLEDPLFVNLIYKIDYLERKPLIERIFAITSNIKWIVIILSLIFGLVAILIFFNTIRLSIYAQKEEIAIQKLVGASNWFIQGPFIVQGIITGIFAVLISLLIFALGCFFSAPQIETIIPGFNLWRYFTTHLFIIVLIQFVVGAGLGVISSIAAIKKYLKI